MGHAGRGTRHAELGSGAAQLEVWRSVPEVHLADVGVLPESRLLPIYEWIYDRHWSERRDGFGARELSAGTSGGKATAGGSAADEPAAVVRRWLCAGYVPPREEYDDRLWSAI